MTKSKITILMTVYNGERYILDSLSSVFNQSFNNWSLLIIDNNSNDNTKSILEKIDDYRVKIIYLDKNISRVRALNLGVSKIDTELVAILDSDDIAASLWLEQALEFYSKNKSIGVISGWAKLIDKEGKIFRTLEAPHFPKKINELFSFTFPIVHSSTIFKLKLLQNINGPYDCKKLFGHDWDLMIKLSKITPIVTLNLFWVYWRRYDESLTGNKNNSILGRLDKIANYQSGGKCSNNKFYLIKNRNRMASEYLGLSILYLKKNEIKNFFKFLLLSIIKNPFAIVTNQKFLNFFKISPDFQNKVK